MSSPEEPQDPLASVLTEAPQTVPQLVGLLEGGFHFYEACFFNPSDPYNPTPASVRALAQLHVDSIIGDTRTSRLERLIASAKRTMERDKTSTYNPAMPYVTPFAVMFVATSVDQGLIQVILPQDKSYTVGKGISPVVVGFDLSADTVNDFYTNLIARNLPATMLIEAIQTILCNFHISTEFTSGQLAVLEPPSVNGGTQGIKVIHLDNLSPNAMNVVDNAVTLNYNNL